MQNVIELPFSEGYFLMFAVIVSIILMVVATTILFIGKTTEKITYTAEGYSSLTKWTTVLSKTPLVITVIALGLMAAGISAFVGFSYATSQPVFNDYFWNLIGVGAIACLIGVLVAYGIATLGLYAHSTKRW
jgi:hypothetical protein